MGHTYLYIFLLSLIPGFEGRYALLMGPPLGLDIIKSLLIASLATVTLGVTLPLLFPHIDKLLSRPSLGVAHRMYTKYILRVREKVKNKERITIIGLIAFVAAPVPLTGVWTGSAVSYILGLGKKSIPALIVGGLLSNILTFTAGYVYASL